MCRHSAESQLFGAKRVIDSKKFSEKLKSMAGHHKIEINQEQLRAIAALCRSYGQLFEDASRDVKEPVAIDGIQTIHSGLKSMRRACEKLVGITKLPSDSEFDNWIHETIVKGGKNADYNAKAGRRWSIKEKREMLDEAEKRTQSPAKRKRKS